MNPEGATSVSGLFAGAAPLSGASRATGTVTIRGEGAYLIVDIVGSSRIGATLVEEGGRRGADRLSRLMGSTFNPLMAVVAATGGEVVELAGDALQAIWRHKGHDVPGFRARIVAAANTMAAALDQRRTDGGDPVLARMGLGFGAIETARGFGQSLTTGAAFRLAVAALAQAEPGGIIVESDKGGARIDPGGPGVEPILLPNSGVDMTAEAPTSIQNDGETRVFTAMAVGLIGPGEAMNTQADHLLAATATAAEALAPFAATVRRPHLDEKGLGIFALFGHRRGNRLRDRADLFDGIATLRDALAPLGIEPSIGVAGGRVFVARIAQRIESRHLLYGMPLVVAARLAQSAEGRTLVDADIAGFARRDRIGCSGPVPVAVKPGEASIEAYALSAAAATPEAVEGPLRLIGRQRETAAIEAMFDNSAGRRGLVFDGATGMGKSALLREAERFARRRNVRVAVLSQGAGHRGAPLAAWRSVFDGLDTDFPAMAGEAADIDRATDALIQRWGDSPPLLIVDDAHWLDEPSTILLRRLWRALPGMRAILSCDPFVARSPERWLRTLLLGAEDRISLAALDLDETRDLLRERLGLDDIDERELVAFHALCEGAPEAILEIGAVLGARLRRHAHLSSTRALGPAGDEIELPLDLTQAIEQRIDALTVADRAVLKAASAAGRSIDRRLLLRLGLGDEAMIDRALAAAHANGILTPDPDRGDGAYVFRTQTIWNVAYGMTAESTAADLHARIARAIGDDADLPLDERTIALASHWTRAGHASHAVRHLSRAGGLALRSGAHGEALRAYERALRFADQARASGHRPLASAWREALWCARAADASLVLGDLDRGLRLCARGLERLGEQMATRPSGWAVQVLRAAPRMVGHAIAPGTFAGRARRFGETARRRVAARLLVVASECLYFKSDVVGMLCAATLASNHYERAKALAEAARPRAMLVYAVGVSGAPGLARRLMEGPRKASEGQANLEGLSYCTGADALVTFARGSLHDALPLAERSLVVGLQRGNPLVLGMARTVVGMMYWHAGRFADAEDQFRRLGDVARRSANDQHLTWSFCSLASALLPRGDTNGAAAALAEAARLMAIVEDDLCALNLDAYNAELAFETGDHDSAIDRARRAVMRAQTTPVSNWGSFEGFFGPTETLLACVIAQGETPMLRACLADAQRGADRAARFARMFRFASPRLLQHRAVLLALGGKHGKARRDLTQSSVLATRLGAPYEHARAQALLASLTPGAEGRLLRTKALSLADTLGAGFTGIAAAALCRDDFAFGGPKP